MIATARKSLPALHRAEKAAFRAMTETFRTMILLDKQGCDDAAYLRISALYRVQCDEHTAILADLNARYAVPVPEPTPPSGGAALRLVDTFGEYREQVAA